MKGSYILTSMMNGDIQLLRVNGDTFNLDLIHHCQITGSAKKIYGLTKLSDGRVCFC